jgi:hypothetical protein
MANRNRRTAMLHDPQPVSARERLSLLTRPAWMSVASGVEGRGTPTRGMPTRAISRFAIVTGHGLHARHRGVCDHDAACSRRVRSTLIIDALRAKTPSSR